MKIKDFKVGQIVYLILQSSEKGLGTNVAVVTKIGRKYITVKVRSSLTARFAEYSEYSPYLIEDVKGRGPRLLFTSCKAIDEYRSQEELKSLRSWLQMAARWEKTDRYTLDQLRTVKKILEREGTAQ